MATKSNTTPPSTQASAPEQQPAPSEPKGAEVSNPLAPTASPTPQIEGEPQGASLTDKPNPDTGKLENPDVVRVGGDVSLLTGASADVKKGPNVIDEEAVRREREQLVKDAQANPDQKAQYKVISGSVKHGDNEYAAQGSTVELTGAQAAGLLASGVIEKALSLPKDAIPVAYWTLGDLVVRLGADVVINTLDDDNDGVPDTAVVLGIQQLSDGHADAYIMRAYHGTLPIPADPVTGHVPNMVRALSLAWARVLCFQRRPSYAREYGKTPTEEAQQLGESLAAGQLFLSDSTTETQPTVVGGLITDNSHRIILPNFDGSSNSGDF